MPRTKVGRVDKAPANVGESHEHQCHAGCGQYQRGRFTVVPCSIFAWNICRGERVPYSLALSSLAQDRRGQSWEGSGR
jgi:hypothetical protein